MLLSSTTQGGSESCPGGQEPEVVPATKRDDSMTTLRNGKLRAQLKKNYYEKREAGFGAGIKVYWKHETWMLKVVDLMPEFHGWHLMQLCNKPTILYWELSAQGFDPRLGLGTGIVFACIYKCWFRCHGNNPDIDFGNFFAQPLQITPTGPQTIPEILKAHAHLYDRAASESRLIKDGDNGPIEQDQWQDLHLLPLCRAIIVLLDEFLPPPERKRGETISLDDEMQRRIAVLVLTGDDRDLSAALNFDSIRSKSLPLARQDVSTAGSANVIRISLKTAVQFIAELQEREKKNASSSARRDSADTTPESTIGGGSVEVEKADAHVEDVLENALKSSYKWGEVQYALEIVKAKERGEYIPEGLEFNHWFRHWV